jgi:hypothetical protein
MTLFSVKVHHTLDLNQAVNSSTGVTFKYFDGIGAMLCNECHEDIMEHFKAGLFLPAMPSWPEAEARFGGDIDNGRLYSELLEPDRHGLSLWPVASGASGAIILGRLDHGSYLRPKDKAYGPLWRELEVAQLRKYVAIVDDCIFTGNTMDYAQEECAKAGLVVVREVVLLGARPDISGWAALSAGGKKGCPCACHNGQEGIYHAYACHSPLLTPLSWGTVL